MDERFSQFPKDLATRSRSLKLGAAGVPTLLAHPDWQSPAPVMLWMHGRTVNKELDPGRYLRWIRAGIAAVAIDLPGHGERFDPRLQEATGTLDMLEQALGDVDQVLDALARSEWAAFFDFTRVGIGGMSAGGMVTLRRLCDPAPGSLPNGFAAAAVEGTTGWLEGLYYPEKAGLPRPVQQPIEHPVDRLARLDPMRNRQRMKPLPMLVLHSQADEVVPWAGMSVFIERLKAHYRQQGADPSMIQVVTWTSTGAPQEHAGF
ncbi:MAG: alpha/beta fold hydrolase, partial [Phycisphaerales bacterium]|nr:alpha/beta fold hydrolase [Phycisphaerales bacterium]